MVEVKGATGGALRDLTDRLRQQESAVAVLAGAADDGRAFLVFNLDQSLADKGLDAVALVRDAAKHIQGGGRRPADARRGGRQEAGGARRRARRGAGRPSLAQL